MTKEEIMEEAILKIFWSEEDESFIAKYRNFSGIGDTQREAITELTVALSGVVDMLAEENGKAKWLLRSLWEEFGEQWEHINIYKEYQKLTDPMYPVWKVGLVIKKALEIFDGPNEGCTHCNCGCISGEGTGTEQGVQSAPEPRN